MDDAGFIATMLLVIILLVLKPKGLGTIEWELQGIREALENMRRDYAQI